MSGPPNSLPARSEAPEGARFRLLGPVEVWSGDHPIDLGGPLQRALLACLLLRRGEVVSRERLIDALWDIDPPPRAIHTLETKVSRLRAALGSEASVLARGGGYVLEVPADHVDVYRFQQDVADARGLLAADPYAAQVRLVAALRLWRGSALGGVSEGLLSVERDRLEEERLEAIEARIDADLALGAGPLLVSELEALRREHPLRERFTEQLMIAMYRSGRQAHALETYRAARRALVDELGLEPSRRLRELEQAILRQDASLGPLPLAQRLARTVRRPQAVAAIAAGCAAVLLVLVLAIGPGGKHARPAPLRPGLLLLNAATGSIRANVPVGESQQYTTFGEGFVWTMGESGIMSQVDPRHGRLVRAIAVGVMPGGLTAGAGSVWVSDRNSPALLRIDALTGQVNRRAHLSQSGLRHPLPTGGIAFDDGSLWVARGSEAIDRMDPSTLRLQHRIRLDQRSCGTPGCPIAAGGGRVWMAGGDNATLTGIEEATNRVVATAKLRPYLCCVAVGGGSVWVAEAHGVAQLSPEGRLRRRFGVGSASVGNIAYDRGYLWATADTAGKLLRIGAQDGHVRTTHLGNLLIGTAAHAGTVVANANPLPTDPTRGLGRKVLRIGLTQDWLNTADPAVTRSPSGTGRWQWQLHNATCAELYRHPDAAGAADAAPQPELAAGTPHRSAGGHTWTIALRGGMRFSPPLNRPVTGEDIRASLVRALSPQLGPFAHAAGVLRGVVGIRAYRRGAAEDVAGISLRRGTLVIRTVRPVNDLAARLALPYFCVLPAGIPTPTGGYPEPLPTAGPYYLAAHQGGERAVLRPNPGYHGPRPQRLDGLIFELNVDDRIGVSDVRRGHLDYFAGRHEAVSSRVGCRLMRADVPGPDLAALCLAPSQK